MPSRPNRGELERALASERRARKTCERNEARLHRLIDAINEGIVTVDRNGRITWLNRALCVMMGYSREEAIDRHPVEFLDEDNRRIFEDEFRRRMSGEHRPYEIEWIRKDGSRLCTLVAPQPLYESGDDFSGSVSVISDITALKRAEEELRIRERRFRELVDYANSIILRWDVDGTIRFMNPFGLDCFGYGEDEIMGRNVIDTIVPRTDSSGADLVTMIEQIGEHPELYVRNENEMRDAKGRRFWVMWTNRGIRDASGRITEVLSIGTDVTELKQAREALARQRDELTELNAFIRSVFGRYVSEAVVRRLLDSPEGLEVGGSERCVTILVADVRGFSSICEELKPGQIITMLNTYLEVMTGVIERYDGTIDELFGDGILVLFGAPLSVENHASRGVACALAMQLAMDEVNRRNRDRGLPALEIGIGVHTGTVVAGNIGCARRAKYGVVGATVNLAARIESYTVGGQILVSDATRRRLRDRLELGARVQVEPKGVRAPINVHEVLGITGDYDLALARDAGATMRSTCIDCRYFVLEEKFVGRTEFRGTIEGISESGAVLSAETPLAQLANLKVEMPVPASHDGHSAEKAAGTTVDVYAKVVRLVDDDPLRVELRFTSLSPRVRQNLAGFAMA